MERRAFPSLAAALATSFCHLHPAALLASAQPSGEDAW